MMHGQKNVKNREVGRAKDLLAPRYLTVWNIKEERQTLVYSTPSKNCEFIPLIATSLEKVFSVRLMTFTVRQWV
jgi:hypothetical protein